MNIRTCDRPSFLVIACALLAAGCADPGAGPSGAGSGGDHADSVFHNGRIYTADDGRSWVEAVAIKDGRFLSAGPNEAVLSLAGPQTVRHDLDGAMAMPGLHDAHFHVMAISMSLDCSPPFFTPDRLKETLEYCRTRRIEDHPWLIINNLVLWGESSTITNEAVNEVFPDIPVLIRDTSGHMRLVNDRALEEAGIGENTPDPEGGRIVKHPQTGKPTGVLVELAAFMPVEGRIPPYPDEVLNQALENMFDELFSFGITSIQDAYLFERDILYRLSDLDRQGKPTPYMLIHLGWSHPESAIKRQKEELIRDRDQFASRRLSTAGIKVLLDGVPVPPAFTHVPLREDGTVDETNLLVPRGVLAEKLIEWDKAGLKVKMHCSAKGSVRVGLDAIEAMRAENGYSGIWHEIAHAGDVHADDVPRFAELQAVAEISPYFWHEGVFSASPDSYQFRTLENAGAMITVGSDNIILPSFNPFPPLQGVVTREGESVPLESAIDFYTRNPAAIMDRLDETGSIEPGKIANMIILDRNLFEISPGEIGETRVLLTVLDGDVVYSRK